MSWYCCCCCCSALIYDTNNQTNDARHQSVKCSHCLSGVISVAERYPRLSTNALLQCFRLESHLPKIFRHRSRSLLALHQLLLFWLLVLGNFRSKSLARKQFSAKICLQSSSYLKDKKKRKRQTNMCIDTNIGYRRHLFAYIIVCS